MANGGGDVGELGVAVSALVEALQAPAGPVIWVRSGPDEGHPRPDRWHRLASYRRDTRQFVTACNHGLYHLYWHRLEFSVSPPPEDEFCNNFPNNTACAEARAAMRRATSQSPAHIPEPKTIRMPRKDHQPSTVEMEEQVDMPGMSDDELQRTFFQPFRFVHEDP